MRNGQERAACVTRGRSSGELESGKVHDPWAGSKWRERTSVKTIPSRRFSEGSLYMESDCKEMQYSSERSREGRCCEVFQPRSVSWNVNRMPGMRDPLCPPTLPPHTHRA